MAEDAEPVNTHLECQLCGSSDAGAVYADGHFHCFSCRSTEPAYKGQIDTIYEDRMNTTKKTPTTSPRMAQMLEGMTASPLTDRRISAAVVDKYGVKVDDTKEQHLYPYRDADGVLVGIKTRYNRNKTFSWEGNGQSALFGQHLFSPGGKAITLCEGEIDTLAAHQMNGAKWPVVGIPSATGIKAVKENREYLTTFDNIYLTFDNDDAGRRATE